MGLDNLKPSASLLCRHDMGPELMRHLSPHPNNPDILVASVDEGCRVVKVTSGGEGEEVDEEEEEGESDNEGQGGMEIEEMVRQRKGNPPPRPAPLRKGNHPWQRGTPPHLRLKMKLRN